jgi:hypothetical protein
MSFTDAVAEMDRRLASGEDVVLIVLTSGVCLVVNVAER